MAELLWKRGDLCDAIERMILHGCNAQGVMGSGVARALRTKWPYVYEHYRTEYENKGFALGDVVFTQIYHDDSLTIANMITQEFYGSDGKKYASYSAIVKGLEKVRRVCERLSITEVASAAIGCGLGGLKRDFVFELMNECLTEHGITVTVYEK